MYQNRQKKWRKINEQAFLLFTAMGTPGIEQEKCTLERVFRLESRESVSTSPQIGQQYEYCSRWTAMMIIGDILPWGNRVFSSMNFGGQTDGKKYTGTCICTGGLKNLETDKNLKIFIADYCVTIPA